LIKGNDVGVHFPSPKIRKLLIKRSSFIKGGREGVTRQLTSCAQWACYLRRSARVSVMEPLSPVGMVMLGKFVSLCKKITTRSIGLK